MNSAAWALAVFQACVTKGGDFHGAWMGYWAEANGRGQRSFEEVAPEFLEMWAKTIRGEK